MRCFLNFTSFFLSSACIHMLIFSLPTFILFWWLLIHVNQQEMNSLQYSGLEIWTSSFSFSSLLIFLFFYFFIFFNFLFIFWNFLLIFSSPFFSLSLCLTSISDMNSFAHILTRSRISEAISTSSSFRCFEKEIHHTFCKAKQISF